jgi:crotonobetainyl-CoA:carnitine CoA-transferase CaiB-like acyl-CoA transferase
MMLLEDVRILDLSTLLPGPMCTLFLADLGADVIKIESPLGDNMRNFEKIGEKSPYFEALNRNKKSVAINLKTNEGKKIFYELAKNADVIIEGFRPGVVKRLGISYEDVKKINEKIIFCSITGYGQSTSKKDSAGHDLNYSSLSGLLDVLNYEPIVPGVQMADAGSALVAGISILAALFNRERKGKGNFIDVSIFNSTLSLISIHIAHSSISENRKTLLSGNMPCYNVYQTKDNKYMALGAAETKFWKTFCEAAGSKGLLGKQFDGEAIGKVQSVFKSKNRDEWAILNEKNNFCCEDVKKIKDVLKDNELRDNNSIIKINGISQAAFPAIFSESNLSGHVKAPKLGQHTEVVLKSLGYDLVSIDRLKKKSAIL